MLASLGMTALGPSKRDSNCWQIAVVEFVPLTRCRRPVDELMDICDEKID